MSIAWTDGAAESKTITWLHFETACLVNKEKELTLVEVRPTTKTAGAGYFDSIQLLKNLTNDKVMGSEKIFHLFNDEVSGEFYRPIFGAIADAKIVAAHLVPAEDIIGSDSDYMQFRLINNLTAEVICTKTFLSGIDAVQNEVADFGPVTAAYADIAAGQSVSLIKDNFGTGMTMPKCLFIIEWDLN